MLAPAVIREIECLLKQERLSHRKIARLVGVARGTVAAVARGQRSADGFLHAADPESVPAAARRCPDCGARVRMPCRLCQTRELMAGGHLPPAGPTGALVIGLQLRPEHLARYGEVRRRRREAQRRKTAGRSDGPCD